jgi:hypothetical protein
MLKVILISDNDALLIEGKGKRREEKNISGAILVVFIIESFYEAY